jgi:hypothetical protein
MDCTTPCPNNLQNFNLMKLTILSKRNWTLILVAGGLVLASCSGLSPKPAETPTPAFTETPSPTVVWFPPTNTPTPLPTQTIAPTANNHPGMGDLIFSDSFNRPDLWNTSSSSWASATVTSNRLVLSITGQGPLSILSLRSQPMVDNFYAEATATISLCRDKDQYGMVFRAAGEDYYRFTVNCNGQIRLERGNSGSIWPLLDWQPSGDAPSGAPAQVSIGIWSMGSEMRFYLDDRYQFTVSDSALHSGTLGFFAYANGTTPVAVSFSDLKVYSVFYVSPTPTLTPSRTPTP